MWHIDWASSSRLRAQIYAALAGGYFLLAVVMGIGKATMLGQPFDLPVSDGRFYYAYLPAIIIHGEFDFENSIHDHWGVDYHPALLQNRTETGNVRNKYPLGFALTLLPAFLLGHIVAVASGGWILADGYSWPYQLACLALIQFLIYRTLISADDILTRRLQVAADASLAGLLLMGLGTPYLYYACREPFMVHAVSAFWCMTAVALADAGRRGPLWLWPRLAFACGMALVCRPTNAHLVFVGLYGASQAIAAAGWRQTLLLLPLTAAALVPIGAQLVFWHEHSGQWIYYSYGDEGFNWAHPALVETLFSSRHGLFFWSPILLFATLALYRRIGDPLVLCWLLGGVLLWYANSAWYCWWFGDAFGARAFLELSGLFGIGLALLFEAMRGLPRFVPLMIFAAVVLFNLTMMLLYITHRLPRDGYLFN